VGFAADPRAILENQHLLLRPITPEDREAQRAIALDEPIWRYFVTLIRTDADFDAFFDAGLADQEAGRRVVFHIIDKGSGQAAGSMSFGNLSPNDLRLEIGWSWLGLAFQGKGINRWAKFLMLQHAFEQLGTERVEFKTDARNERARRALAALPAEFEGVHRKHMVVRDGERRDSAWYSVIDDEWPAVRSALEARIERKLQRA